MLENQEIIEGLLTFLFAFGYGFFTPALFSLMSQKIKEDHFGKLFGVIDSTETLALCLNFLSFFIINKIKIIQDNIYIIVLCFFLISFIFFLTFITRFRTYEKDASKK